MPRYTWLRPDSDDSDEILKTKQRAAHKIKTLRAAIGVRHWAARILT